MADPRNRYASSIDALNTTFASLSPEAATVFTEARAQLDQWIESKFSELSDRAKSDVNQSREELVKLRDEIKAEQSESETRMAAAIARLDESASGLSANDQKLAKRVSKVLAAAEEVKAELAAREKKWTALGEKAFDAVSKTAKTVVDLAL